MEITVTKSNFEEEVINSDVPVLLDFWATWCGPCRMIAPILEEIAEEYDGRVTVGKVNVDDESELAVQFGITSIPTVILFDKGEQKSITVGYKDKEYFLKLLGL
ncbi:MAG: thioredoxin [Clostridia bacterium]|nr:thioredoxin [Clostridia bacterium]